MTPDRVAAAASAAASELPSQLEPLLAGGRRLCASARLQVGHCPGRSEPGFESEQAVTGGHGHGPRPAGTRAALRPGPLTGRLPPLPPGPVTPAVIMISATRTRHGDSGAGGSESCVASGCGPTAAAGTSSCSGLTVLLPERRAWASPAEPAAGGGG
jgi:hypothetical protein